MNKRELVDSITEQTGVDKDQVAKVINTFITTVVGVMNSDDKVRLREFGVFTPITQDERLVRNPRTGEEMMFKTRKSFRFKPGEDVLRKINKS